MAIVVLGEVLFDRMVRESAPGGGEVFLGGASANCAAGLARAFDREACFLGGIGADEFGDRAYAALADMGVSLQYAKRTDMPTRVVRVLVDGETGERSFDGFEISESGTYADQELDAEAVEKCFAEQSVEMAYTGTLIFAGGSSAEAARKMLVLAREKGVAVFADVNIREFFFESEEDLREALRLVLSSAQAVKMSEEELGYICEHIFGVTVKVVWEEKRGVEEAVETVLKEFSNIAILLVTFGEKGSYARRRDGEDAWYEVRDRAATDATGAGDAYSAGAMASMLKQMEADVPLESANLEDTLESASAAGRRAASHSGALGYLVAHSS